MSSRIHRRTLLKSTAASVVAAGSTACAAAQSTSPSNGSKQPGVCLFSKCLQNRPVRDLPPILHELKIDALDLTCRPGGHVLPQQVAEDLPRAVETLRQAGIAVPMITTAITDADADEAENIVKTAASLGIRYIKLGYYYYGKDHRVLATLTDVKRRLEGVVDLCRKHGVQAGFHNHSGRSVGAAMWDVWELLKDLPTEALGSYFDLRHATAEGGDGGWRIGLDLLAPRIVMVAVKDFLWEKPAGKPWRPHDVPLGEGMVHLDESLTRLKQIRMNGPVSLHMEYGEHTPPVGSDADRANLEAVRKDWETLQRHLRQTGWNPHPKG